jgi:hypothetical protein
MSCNAALFSVANISIQDKISIDAGSGLAMAVILRSPPRPLDYIKDLKAWRCVGWKHGKPIIREKYRL